MRASATRPGGPHRSAHCLGLVFAVHGSRSRCGPGKTSAFFRQGLDPVTRADGTRDRALELIGGILLVLGWATRWLGLCLRWSCWSRRSGSRCRRRAEWQRVGAGAARRRNHTVLHRSGEVAVDQVWPKKGSRSLADLVMGVAALIRVHCLAVEALALRVPAFPFAVSRSLRIGSPATFWRWLVPLCGEIAGLCGPLQSALPLSQCGQKVLCLYDPVTAEKTEDVSMPADPAFAVMLRHTGTNHVRHGGSPEIVEQKAGGRPMASTASSKRSGSHAPALLRGEHSITDPGPFGPLTRRGLASASLHWASAGGLEAAHRFSAVSRGGHKAPCPVPTSPRHPSTSPAPPRQITAFTASLMGSGQPSQKAR